LLEDIDLAGARGILVNVTGGMDMSIGEFEEVGNVVKQFASEDATVVVGTVIDPELEGELRVTMVATGLGTVSQKLSNHIGSKHLRPGRDGRVNYNQLDKPTVMRRGAPTLAVQPKPAAAAPAAQPQAAAAVTEKTDYTGDDGYVALDIPAFLRRQAD